MTERDRIMSAMDQFINKLVEEMRAEGYIIGPDQVEGIVSYTWESRRNQAKKEFQDWLSAHDSGPYAGR